MPLFYCYLFHRMMKRAIPRNSSSSRDDSLSGSVLSSIQIIPQLISPNDFSIDPWRTGRQRRRRRQLLQEVRYP